MKIKKAIFFATLAVEILFNAACDDFLDTIPDNRVDAADMAKDPAMISDMLNSGYPIHAHLLMAEMVSDNADKKTYPSTLSYSYLCQEEMYKWKAVENENGNDDLGDFWTSYYNAIEVANVALEAIEASDNPGVLQSQKGEALLIRAYNHLLLVNMFGFHYNQDGSSEAAVGIPYIEKPQKTVNPTHTRLSVAEVYRRIDRDIEEGLPLIDDARYGKLVKYHFNKQAAYALAARFNLYYGKYDKVIEYANVALGPSLAKILRDKHAFLSLTRDVQIFALKYCESTEPANFMLQTFATSIGTIFANYTGGKLYQHSYLVAYTETVRSDGPWGRYSTSDPYTFNIHSSTYATGTYCVQPNIPYKMEVTNPLTGSGIPHALFVPFTAEETLLCRAEAYILKGEYDLATADLAAWYNQEVNPARVKVALTRSLINSYYRGLNYYTPEVPTVKKHLNPLNFTMQAEGSEQENFLQCLLHFRRIETINMGLRWVDVKRFGIVIYRRDLGAGGGTGAETDAVVAVTDELTLDDYRRAAQVPRSAIDAGLQSTPGYR